MKGVPTSMKDMRLRMNGQPFSAKGVPFTMRRAWMKRKP
jgi:hypothetical protein